MVFKPTLSKDRLNLYCKNITSLNDYSVQLLVYTLVKNNIFPPNSVWNNIEQLLSEKKISHVYEKLLLAIINLFARMDFVDLRQGKIHFTLLLAQYAEKVNQLNLQKHKDRILAEEPLLSVLINLIDKCIVNYPNILTDNLHPFQILFPNGSLKQIEEVYTQDIIANYYNQTLATLILNKIENKLLSSKKISILEVGAGTGATSRYVLLALKHLDQNIDYFYSDVSTTFLNHGIEKFKMDYPFVNFKRLDIEKFPLNDNFKENQFDIIICSNVIHATKNIRKVLTSLKYLLNDNGLLYLNELVSNPLYITLIFGLTYGWWHFEDTDRRIPDSPLLTLETWTDLLKSTGFSEIHTHGNDDINHADLKQAIIEAC